MKIDPSRLAKMFEEVDRLVEAEVRNAVVIERTADEFTTREYAEHLRAQGQELGEHGVMGRLKRAVARGEMEVREGPRRMFLWKVKK